MSSYTGSTILHHDTFSDDDDGMVGNLPYKDASHWDNVSTEYWDSCGITVRPHNQHQFTEDSRVGISLWDVKNAMFSIQESLIHAARCDDKNMILAGKLHSASYWNNRKRTWTKEYSRCPYHVDLLPNWKQFTDQLEAYNGGIKCFSIRDVMLPTCSYPSPPFFSTKIMPILTANIATITNLELVCCNLRPRDVDCISEFVKKNKWIDFLFGPHDRPNWTVMYTVSKEDWDNRSAKLLSKAMRNHLELSFLNLTNTGLTSENNEALQIILDGCKGINCFIMEEEKGITTMTNFLQKKNEMSVFSLEGTRFADYNENIYALKQCLRKNSTLAEICLGSNNLGAYTEERVFASVISSLKGNSSLTYVDLSNNDISRMNCARLIAKYLATNPSLIELDLSENDMPTRAAEVVMVSLKKNSTLERLSFGSNAISDKCVPVFTDALQSNSTLRTLDLKHNNLKVQTGRKGMIKALCDTTSLDTVANKSNHTCSIVIAGSSYGGTYERELNNINALENEGQKIRYKVVLTLCLMNKDLGKDRRVFDDVPLELIPRLIELVQQEIGCKGYGEGIVRSVRKRNSINRLSNIYEAIHQWPSFPLLFMRGPGKLKKRKRKAKVADDEEDWVPKSKKVIVGARSSGRHRKSSAATVSYADVENSEDES